MKSMRSPLKILFQRSLGEGAFVKLNMFNMDHGALLVSDRLALTVGHLKIIF
jgi:hypothetical protein